MKSNTSLGTLGRVLEILKEEGVVDIPETTNPESIAYEIVFTMNKEKLFELVSVISGGVPEDISDDKAVSILTDFFTNMEDSLKRFVATLNRDFEKQKVLVTETIDKMINPIVEEIISSIDFDSLSKMVSEQFPTK